MKRFSYIIICITMALFMGFMGCGDKKESDEELVLGNWTHYRNRAYILLIINPKGIWSSSVRVADATSKIVKSKGAANGTWHHEKGQLIFTVIESDIEEIWEKNDTSFFEIVELGKQIMLLKEENGRIAEWKKTFSRKPSDTQADLSVVVPMKPIAVNLNKISSNSQDRYLCLDMKMVLKELMPDQVVPSIHPKAREAAIVFLSSLVYQDVMDFERVKAQKDRLVNVLNPYMDGFIKDIEINHVIVSTTIEKVEEFLIEHTLGPATQEGEQEESTDDAKKGSEDKDS